MAEVKTYLNCVNAILRRLREDEVASVTETAYSTLIGDFVNVAKKRVEMAWNWEGLRITQTVSTTAAVQKYALPETYTDLRNLVVWNDTNNVPMRDLSTEDSGNAYLMNDPATGAPTYYYQNGLNASGEVYFELYPIPDGVYSIRFDIVAPLMELSANTDVLYVPYQPVYEIALALAMAERGEDGGVLSNQQMQYAMQVLGDWVATEASNRPAETTWTIQ